MDGLAYEAVVGLTSSLELDRLLAFEGVVVALDPPSA